MYIPSLVLYDIDELFFGKLPLITSSEQFCYYPYTFFFGIGYNHIFPIHPLH